MLFPREARGIYREMKLYGEGKKKGKRKGLAVFGWNL